MLCPGKEHNRSSGTSKQNDYLSHRGELASLCEALVSRVSDMDRNLEPSLTNLAVVPGYFCLHNILIILL